MSMQVQLHISCRKLKDLDIFSKSDPIVHFFILGRQGKWVKSGQTELINNNLNPDFKTFFTVNYQFEQ